MTALTCNFIHTVYRTHSSLTLKLGKVYAIIITSSGINLRLTLPSFYDIRKRKRKKIKLHAEGETIRRSAVMYEELLKRTLCYSQPPSETALQT